MFDQARQLRFPFMAGSSIPVTVRVPELELALDTTDRACAGGRLRRSRRLWFSYSRDSAMYGRAPGGRRERPPGS
jgi:hypothetical protein